MEEYVPEEGEMKGVLEEKIFGGLLPKAVRRLKPPRNGVSERWNEPHSYCSTIFVFP